jgi:hypothetical protein
LGAVAAYDARHGLVACTPVASPRVYDVTFETIGVHVPAGASGIDTYGPDAIQFLPNFAKEPTLAP